MNLFKISVLYVFVSFFYSVSTQASVDENLLKESTEFLKWVEDNSSEFKNCNTSKDGKIFQLCDKTEVSLDEVNQLLNMSLKEKVDFFQRKKINLRLICTEDDKMNKDINRQCATEKDSEKFKKMSALHGLFDPVDHSITVKANTSAAVIAHEYLHYLQFQNTSLVAGRLYKKQRHEIQTKIIKRLDELMIEIKDLENRKLQQPLMEKAKVFISINDLLLKMGRWQDYIDERGVFSFFLNNKNKLKLTSEDILLIEKNIKAICQRKELKELIMPECN